MKKLGIFLVSSLLIFDFATAGQADLSWTAPTQNTDGSLIVDSCAADPSTCLAGYKIYYGTTTGVYNLGPDDIPDPNIVSYTVPNLTEGQTYFFVATAYNVGGIESTYSGEVSKTIASTTQPNPPTGLTVNPDNLTAYTYSISVNKVVMIPVGTVPSNTPCDSTMSMNGYNLVDTSSVTLIGSIQPPVTFADCI